MSRAFVSKTSIKAETLRAKALAGYLAGRTGPQIAQELCVTRERAWQLGKEALQRLIAETIDKAEEWRAVLTQKWLAHLATGEDLRDKAMTTGDLQALEASAPIIEKALQELGKLWGAYAATKAESSIKADLTASIETASPRTVESLKHLTAEQLSALEKVLIALDKANQDHPLQ